jgi:DNA-binding transcriptional LysR family regulator
MTLTELKYIVAVARHKHFGHPAEACFVAQPTLSVAIKKLEDELGVVIFERGGSEISMTPLGALIVAQAERVLEQTASIREIVKQNKDPIGSVASGGRRSLDCRSQFLRALLPVAVAPGAVGVCSALACQVLPV